MFSVYSSPLKKGNVEKSINLGVITKDGQSLSKVPSCPAKSFELIRSLMAHFGDFEDGLLSFKLTMTMSDEVVTQIVTDSLKKTRNNVLFIDDEKIYRS